jgi:hypothetical protein
MKPEVLTVVMTTAVAVVAPAHGQLPVQSPMLFGFFFRPDGRKSQ